MEQYFILSPATRRNPAPVGGGRYFLVYGSSHLVDVNNNIVNDLVDGKIVIPDEVLPGAEIVVECLGAGCHGAVPAYAGLYISGGQGGGAGQWSRRGGEAWAMLKGLIIVAGDMTVNPGDQFDFQCGQASCYTGTVGSPSSPSPTDTWFRASDWLYAQGAGGDEANLNGRGGQFHPVGDGLAGGAPFPWEWNDVVGNSNVDAAQAANGGCGAAGPFGQGQKGGNAAGLWEGGSGGGGADGGDEGGVNTGSGGGFVGLGGGYGGPNRLATGGGQGSSGTLGGPTLEAGDGIDGAGGGGGYGRAGVDTLPTEGLLLWQTDGGKGGLDYCWGNRLIGPGGGGGGAGGGNGGVPFGYGVAAANGGDSGGYGAGGGGCTDITKFPGLGGDGVIVISWGSMIGVYYGPSPPGGGDEGDGGDEGGGDIGGPEIPLADRAAVFAMFEAGVGVSGGQSYRMLPGNYIGMGLYGYDMSSNPINLIGQAGVEWDWSEITGTSGVNFKDFNVYGNNPSYNAGVVIHDGAPVLTFTRVTTIADVPMGTQNPGNGFFLRDLTGGSVSITGHMDKSKNDIWGRNAGVGFYNCLGTCVFNVKKLTIRNVGIDAIIGASVHHFHIEQNYISDQFWGPGDHPDAIQFFGDLDDFTIKNNGVEKGPSGFSQQVIFLENPNNGVISGNWSHTDTFNAGISISGGSNNLVDDNLIEGVTGLGGGVIIGRGGTVDMTVTNCLCSALANYAADGVNTGFVPDPLPGSNDPTVEAATIMDYTNVDAFILSHADTRART